MLRQSVLMRLADARRQENNVKVRCPFLVSAEKIDCLACKGRQLKLVSADNVGVPSRVRLA